MTESCGMHTLARRFCIERAHEWRLKYSDIYRKRPDEPGDISPRVNVLDAILEAVERHEPDGFASFEAARGAILADVWAARNLFTDYTGAVERDAMQDGRRAMARRIEAVTLAEAARAEPLFYRRTLSNEEVAALDARLDTRWNLRGQWFPIGGLLPEPHASQEYLASEFEKYFGLDNLRGILMECGVRRVCEWREWGRSMFADTAQVEISYTGAEGVWCDDSLQWVAYASHEDSLLLGGWLAEEVTRRWPDWEEHVWRVWW